MQAVLDFLRARLATPALRFHAAMVVLMALAMAGLVTTEQITGFLGKATALATVIGPALVLLSKAAGGINPDDVAAVLGEITLNNPEAVKIKGALDKLEGVFDAPPEVHVDLDTVKAAMDRLGVKRTG